MNPITEDIQDIEIILNRKEIKIKKSIREEKCK